ncbi:MAG: HAMP domain-containing histidine kinase [Thermoleophilaceae bacterium]|nr:HAMP domain-containing histidine kinase [Thermoleophilaceae bacterium]
MSLRARLILTLLALSAAGLVVLAAVTYASQRSFQLERVDDQTRAAEPAVGRALAEENGTTPDRERGPGGRDPAAANLPPGTYGVHLDAAGSPVGDPVTLSYDATEFPAPDLPGDLEPGAITTVDAVSGDLQYRVRAARSPDGGYTAVAIPLQQMEETLERLLLVEGLVIAGVLALLAVLSWLLVRAGLRPLERMGDTAGAIAAGELSHRVEPAEERTEVGRLGLALNGMLDRLDEAFRQREASESRLRRFLADVSHELRTPLASIRGYAELFRLGAASDAEETAKAMRRIEEESARMGVLVEDLLALARVDEVRDRPAEAVDLSELVRDAVADARATDPSRAISADTDGEAIVRGDPGQLRQVLANLMRNALVHTRAGTPVEVHVRGDGAGELELEVRDHGPGLPPDVPPEALFDRSYRSTPGDGRAGAGLGLAIVAGIVSAHGGSVTATDAPGGGASFAVRLPAA